MAATSTSSAGVWSRFWNSRWNGRVRVRKNRVINISAARSNTANNII